MNLSEGHFFSFLVVLISMEKDKIIFELFQNMIVFSLGEVGERKDGNLIEDISVFIGETLYPLNFIIFGGELISVKDMVDI